MRGVVLRDQTLLTMSLSSSFGISSPTLSYSSLVSRLTLSQYGDQSLRLSLDQSTSSKPVGRLMVAYASRFRLKTYAWLGAAERKNRPTHIFFILFPWQRNEEPHTNPSEVGYPKRPHLVQFSFFSSELSRTYRAYVGNLSVYNQLDPFFHFYSC
jgi:hypothetical protein